MSSQKFPDADIIYPTTCILYKDAIDYLPLRASKFAMCLSPPNKVCEKKQQQNITIAGSDCSYAASSAPLSPQSRPARGIRQGQMCFDLAMLILCKCTWSPWVNFSLPGRGIRNEATTTRTFWKKKKKALSNNLFLVAHTQNGRRAVKAMRN